MVPRPAAMCPYSLTKTKTRFNSLAPANIPYSPLILRSRGAVFRYMAGRSCAADGDRFPTAPSRMCATAVSAVPKFANGLVSRTADTAMAGGMEFFQRAATLRHWLTRSGPADVRPPSANNRRPPGGKGPLRPPRIQPTIPTAFKERTKCPGEAARWKMGDIVTRSVSEGRDREESATRTSHGLQERIVARRGQAPIRGRAGFTDAQSCCPTKWCLTPISLTPISPIAQLRNKNGLHPTRTTSLTLRVTFSTDCQAARSKRKLELQPQSQGWMTHSSRR